MKLLLVGPFPPPHGGVSVHVAQARQEVLSAGIPCRVLNTDRRAPGSPDYIRMRGRFQLAGAVAQHAVRRWTVHVHTSGHNSRGWVLSLLCGLAAKAAPGSVLTLHSGLTPAYLDAAGAAGRQVAAAACRLYGRIICVNPAIGAAVSALGVPTGALAIVPAFLGSRRSDCALPARVLDWVRSKRPLLSTVLWFRPEYGFDLLLRATAQLRQLHPGLGLLVMGDTERRVEAERTVAAAGQGETLFLTGDVSHAICLALMARSDLFVRATLADGDAVSVREAVSLGIPVVASDVGGRPAAALLFRAGDLADLTSKIQTGLSLARPGVGGSAQPKQPGGLCRLLEIYDQAAN